MHQARLAARDPVLVHPIAITDEDAGQSSIRAAKASLERRGYTI
jgi:hypothetical protein